MKKILMDGGTTNLRISLLGEDDSVIGLYQAPCGVARTAVDGHNGALRQALHDGIAQLLEEHGVLPEEIEICAAYGMLTSGLGLWEIPHVQAPAGVEELRAAQTERLFPDVAPFPIRLLPGVRNAGQTTGPDTLTDEDMMRGEETEAVGLRRLLGESGPCVLVLPGSHNKLIHMDAQGRILRCMTTLSGELLSALTNHTILADAVDRRFADPRSYDAEMVALGAREARTSGIGRAAFAGRILRTLGGCSPEQTAYYLLGVVTQTDADAMACFLRRIEDPSPRVCIAGKEPVSRAIRQVFTEQGVGCVCATPEQSRLMGLRGALLLTSSRGGEGQTKAKE